MIFLSLPIKLVRTFYQKSAAGLLNKYLKTKNYGTGI